MKKLFIALFFAFAGVSANAQMPSYLPTSGLLAWYSFSGNANDNSGNGHNGTVYGATLTNDRFGNANSAYSFDGSSAKINTAFVPPTGNAARTISCWFKYTTPPGTYCDAGFCIAGYGGDTRECYEAGENFSLEINNVGAPTQARVDGICIMTQVAAAADSLDHNWHFFAAVYDPTYGNFYDIKLFIDGAFKTTLTNVYGAVTDVITDSLSTLQIGAGHYDCPRYFNGAIDDIGVWNRALTEGELLGMYYGNPVAAADSFSVYLNNTCLTAQFTILPAHYTSSTTIKTWFGDGTMAIDTPSTTTGVCMVEHTYTHPGAYSIKHVLYDGTTEIDSVTYSKTFSFCNAVLVRYYSDVNANCAYDSGADFLLSVPMLTEIDSNNIPVDTISSASGFYYTAYGNPGDVYSFRPVSYPSSLVPACPASAVISDTLNTSDFISATRYIGMVCSAFPSFDLALHTHINATGTNDQSGNIYVTNNTSCYPVDAVVTLHFGPKFIPEYGSTYNMIPLPTSVTSNSATWNLSALASTNGIPVNLWYAIYHNPATGYLAIGDTVHNYFTVSPMIGDIDTSNNTQIQVDTVKAGCDPNKMQVSPAGCLPATAGATQLQYTIGFENTGTDTAFNITILDTLSDNLDISSMRMVMTSASMNISKLKDLAGQNILRFDFPNIDLLDSSHHGQCDGAVIFTIDTKPALPYSSSINNEAGIYFDYNSVVMTNQVENTIGCSDLNVAAIQQKPVSIYPSPAHDALTIISLTDISNVIIYDVLGQTLYEQDYHQSHIQVNVTNLPAGVYFVKINHSQVQKFIKE